MSTRKPLLRLMALALSLLLLSACAMFEKGPAKPEPKRLPDQREFDDVLVPRDMDIDREASAVYRRDGASIGILRMSGRVDAELAHAVLSEQPAATRAGARCPMLRAPQSLMVFQKANRMAVIALSRTDLTTYADIWVVPMNETFDGTPPKK